MLYKIRIEFETHGICGFYPVQFHPERLSEAKKLANRHLDDLRRKTNGVKLKTEITDEQEKVVSSFKNGFWTDYIGEDNDCRWVSR